MFPVEVSCPKCDESLMDPINPIEGFPSIHLLVRAKGRQSDLWLSSLYGSYRGRLDLDITHGREVEILCPACRTNLAGEPLCPQCEAYMVALSMNRGGMITFCSRFGCRNHAIAFGDLGRVVVASIMNRYVVTVKESDTLLTAAKTLIDYDIYHLPVVSEDGSVSGYLTDKSLLRAAYPENEWNDGNTPGIHEDAENWDDALCGDIPLRPPAMVEPETPLLEAAEIMAGTGEHMLLIQKEGTIVGIISRRDLYRALLREKLR